MAYQTKVEALRSRYGLGMALLLAPLLWTSLASATPVPLGTYKGNGCDGLKGLNGFVSWFGRRPDFVLDFLAMDSWQAMLSDAKWTVQCWQNDGIPVVFSVPMIVKGAGTLADGAAGKFDEQFKSLAQMLVNHGFNNAVVRLGWEFNGGWYPWAAKQDPDSWVAYWRRIVTVMRAVPGAKFRFDWCSAQGWQQIPSSHLYPGDDYVDIIGQDTYNQTWNKTAITPEQRWQDLLTQSYGLNWVRDFARAHNKPMSIPEWGTGTRPDGHGGGDDDYFIARMHEWIDSNNIAYQAYWDYPASDFNGKLSDLSKPKAAAEFIKLFGRQAAMSGAESRLK